MPTLDRVDEVYVLDLGAARNVFNPAFLDAVSAALDEVVEPTCAGRADDWVAEARERFAIDAVELWQAST
jgi:hypothetical protein